MLLWGVITSCLPRLSGGCIENKVSGCAPVFRAFYDQGKYAGRSPQKIIKSELKYI